MFDFRKVGFTVLLLHDVTDIFLYAAKHLKKKYTDQDIRTIRMFTLFVVSFVVLRLICFPLYVFKQCLPTVKDSTQFLCFTGLIILLCLHCYWFIQILGIIKNLLLGKEENKNKIK